MSVVRYGRCNKRAHQGSTSRPRRLRMNTRMQEKVPPGQDNKELHNISKDEVVPVFLCIVLLLGLSIVLVRLATIEWETRRKPTEMSRNIDRFLANLNLNRIETAYEYENTVVTQIPSLVL